MPIPITNHFARNHLQSRQLGGYMTKNYFHRAGSKQATTWFALFTLMLVVVAPLISVFLQKDTMKMMPGMMHPHTPMMGAHHVGLKQGQMPDDHAEACGYCVLLAHVPGLLSAPAVLIFALMLRLSLQLPPPVIQLRHFFFWLYPHPRAPPQLATFTD